MLLLLCLIVPLVVGLPASIIAHPASVSIPGRYILLKKGPAHVYKFSKFTGFAAELPDDIVSQLRNLPGVEYIEQDAIVKAYMGEKYLGKETYVTQTPSTWALARISNQNYGNNSYTYNDSAGSGTCVYVLDTGIATLHPEFEGRAAPLANFASDSYSTDGNGHGTHCAGIIGSKTYGVAKKTKLYAVKVLDASGTGSISSVIAGISFVANDAITRSCPNGTVANLSLGGIRSTALNAAAATAVSSGLFMTVAAGNTAEDANSFSPASEPTVFTVGATDFSDRLASFSNFGTAVDILAPGVAIQSTWLNNETNTLSGTSMAAPHVAGLAAYILALQDEKITAALSSYILSLALKNKITGLPSSTNNFLAYNGNPRG